MSHTKKGFAHIELLIAAIGVLLVIAEVWVFTKYDLHHQDNSSPVVNPTAEPTLASTTPSSSPPSFPILDNTKDLLTPTTQAPTPTQAPPVPTNFSPAPTTAPTLAPTQSPKPSATPTYPPTATPVPIPTTTASSSGVSKATGTLSISKPSSLQWEYLYVQICRKPSTGEAISDCQFKRFVDSNKGLNQQTGGGFSFNGLDKSKIYLIRALGDNGSNTYYHELGNCEELYWQGDVTEFCVVRSQQNNLMINIGNASVSGTVSLDLSGVTVSTVTVDLYESLPVWTSFYGEQYQGRRMVGTYYFNNKVGGDYRFEFLDPNKKYFVYGRASLEQPPYEIFNRNSDCQAAHTFRSYACKVGNPPATQNLQIVN